MFCLSVFLKVFLKVFCLLGGLLKGVLCFFESFLGFCLEMEHLNTQLGLSNRQPPVHLPFFALPAAYWRFTFSGGVFHFIIHPKKLLRGTSSAFLGCYFMDRLKPLWLPKTHQIRLRCSQNAWVARPGTLGKSKEVKPANLPGLH